MAKNRFDGDLGRTVLEYDKNSSTFSGHFAKYANMQYHKEEEEDNRSFAIEKANSFISNPKDEIKKPEITAASADAIKISPVFKKSKPFWKVRPSKKDVSTAKK